jgi:hypothetical protein
MDKAQQPAGSASPPPPEPNPDSIEAVGPYRHLWADAIVGAVEASGVKAAGEHDVTAPLTAGSLEEVVGSDQFGLHGAVEGVLMRNAGQVNRRVDVGHGGSDCGEITNVGGNWLLARAGGAEWSDIEQQQRVEAARKPSRPARVRAP